MIRPQGSESVRPPAHPPTQGSSASRIKTIPTISLVTRTAQTALRIERNTDDTIITTNKYRNKSSPKRQVISKKRLSSASVKQRVAGLTASRILAPGFVQRNLTCSASRQLPVTRSNPAESPKCTVSKRKPYVHVQSGSAVIATSKFTAPSNMSIANRTIIHTALTEKSQGKKSHASDAKPRVEAGGEARNRPSIRASNSSKQYIGVSRVSLGRSLLMTDISNSTSYASVQPLCSSGTCGYSPLQEWK